MARTRPVVLLVLALVVLGVVGQVVPLYTDWLWFQEVGYTAVFLSVLGYRGAVFTAVAVAVPYVLTWPLAVLAAWIGVALLVRAWKLHREG